MVDECASCEADDELLFTCNYCDEQFCSTHQFPHHACEGFGRTAEAGGHSDAADSALEQSAEDRDAVSTADAGADPAGPEADPTADEADPTAGEADPVVPATVTPPGPSARAESLSAGSRGGFGSPHVETGDGVVNVRPMDSRRAVGGTEASAAPRTVGDWIGRQTYLTLLMKVGVIALLVNSAFYGGMTVTLYGLLPFVL